MKRFPLPPNGELGEARISEVEVSTFDAMRSMLDQARSGFPFAVDPGKYKRLHINNVLQMSNTQMERRTNAKFVRTANGNVLIAGLGIGYVLTQITHKETIASVTVIEKSDDLVRLLSPHFHCEKLTIVSADIWQWRPNCKYDVIYFDIWPDVSTDNLQEMTKLHRSFKKYLAPNGWMDSWSREWLIRMKRRGY